MNNDQIEVATRKAAQADRFHHVLYATRTLMEVSERELDAVSDALKETRDQLRDVTYKLHMAENREAMARRDADVYQGQLAQRIANSEVAATLFRKARRVIGISPTGARNLIDQAVGILNPPQADTDTTTPF